eukprot:m.180874 g.180874  ORF g.180874 m.180874 type:complete len:151 (+) comp53449_c0_seq2:35-487(+)
MSTTVHMEGVHVQHGSLERAHAAVRLGFLRKVYGILAAQLALTLLVCTAFSAVPQIKEFVQASSVLFVIAVISSFVTLFALILNRHSYPANIQLLALFTFLEAYTVGTAGSLSALFSSLHCFNPLVVLVFPVCPLPVCSTALSERRIIHA